MAKRLFDLAVSTTLLSLLAPLFAVIALLIKLDSSGPVFYQGVRTGRWGKTFRMFKFRTMYVDPKRIEGTTGLNDPRVTKVGARLRKLKLDELPQLLNVFTGEMSLVGPRPELPRYTDLFTEEEKAILSVRPGITDLSSIRFSSLDEVVGANNVDSNFEKQVLPVKNALRLKYVRERSFLYDLRILVDTFTTLARKAMKSKQHA